MPDHPISRDIKEQKALEKVTPLFQPGSLFHNLNRFPTSDDRPQIDRLDSVLKHGLLALNNNNEVNLSSDIFIGGLQSDEIPYYDYVFIHQYNEEISFMYTLLEQGKFTIFLSPETNFLNIDQLNHDMMMLSQSEVYVKDKVPVDKFIGIGFHPLDLESVMDEYGEIFRELSLPVYNLAEGSLFWPNR